MYARHALLLSQSDHALVSPVRPHWSNLPWPRVPSLQYKTRETPACTVYHTAISRDLYAQPAAQNWSTHAQTGSLSFSYLPGEVERRRSTKQHTVRFIWKIVLKSYKVQRADLTCHVTSNRLRWFEFLRHLLSECALKKQNVQILP